MGRLHYPLVLAVFLLSGLQSSCPQPAAKAPFISMQLFPFLAENGLYGYADSAMNIIITPQYRMVTVFTKTGYAVVQNGELKYGVIDRANKLVMPIKYSAITLLETQGFTLATSELQYHNNLRFWDWKFLPGLSVIGGGSKDKRLFNTTVQRTEKRLSVLENQQTVAVLRAAAALSYTIGFKIKNLTENKLLINNTLYEISQNGVNKLAGNIFGVLDGGLLLQAVGAYYQVIDLQGKRKTSARYRQSDTLHFNINGQALGINVAGNGTAETKKADLFLNENNDQFIYPDLSKKFPLDLNNNVPGIATAELLMQNVWTLDAIPQSDRFLIRFYHNGNFNYRMVDTLGNWHNDYRKFKHFTAVYATGDIVWPPVNSIIPDNMVPENAHITSYCRVKKNHPLYTITISQQSKEKMGVWDDEKGNWICYPKYNYIAALSDDLVYWAVKEERNSRFQLYNLQERKVLTEPVYHDMNADGMVSKYENGKYLYFYFDWVTQREFRAG